MVTAYGYDLQNGSLTSIEHKDGAMVKQGFTYMLNDVGNITRTTHEDGSYWVYTYDDRDRLDSAFRKDNLGVEEYVEAYTYDAGDNLLIKAVRWAGQAIVTTTFSVNDANELTSMTDPNVPDVTYEYGGDGKRRSRTAGSEYDWYNWDGLYVASEEDIFGRADEDLH